MACTRARHKRKPRIATVTEYSLHFLEEKQKTCEIYTIHSYRRALEKVCGYIGDLPLDRIRPAHLTEMTKRMKEEQSQYGMPYSAGFIHHVQNIVRVMLNFAVREGVLEENPIDRRYYSLPRKEPASPVFLELEEARAYIRAALEEEDPKIRAVVLLYLFTGIRMEELCGLEWADIDFAHCRIHIRRASVYVPGEGVLTKPPKTRSGTRTIGADPVLFEVLRAYKAETDAAEGRLFTRRDGGPLIPGSTAVWLKRFAKKHGLRPVTPHKLRHTYASLQIAYGTDIRTVSGIMGHSSPMTTLTIYAHQVQAASDKAAAAMGEMLIPKKIKKRIRNFRSAFLLCCSISSRLLRRSCCCFPPPCSFYASADGSCRQRASSTSLRSG